MARLTHAAVGVGGGDGGDDGAEGRGVQYGAAVHLGVEDRGRQVAEDGHRQQRGVGAGGGLTIVFDTGPHLENSNSHWSLLQIGLANTEAAVAIGRPCGSKQCSRSTSLLQVFFNDKSSDNLLPFFVISPGRTWLLRQR